jgi:hypothetical protein
MYEKISVQREKGGGGGESGTKKSVPTRGGGWGGFSLTHVTIERDGERKKDFSLSVRIVGIRIVG